jgi:Siphovirus Gp157
LHKARTFAQPAAGISIWIQNLGFLPEVIARWRSLPQAYAKAPTNIHNQCYRTGYHSTTTINLMTTANIDKPSPSSNQAIDINRATLAQLSITAAELWNQLENCPEDADLTAVYSQLLDLQNATSSKVDAIAFVADQLKVDLECWEERLKRLTELYSAIIQRRRNQLSTLKAYLLRLYKLGVLPEQVVGTERRIDFQNNPPSVVLKVEPEQLPPQFQAIKVTPKNKEILAAYQTGADVSEFAQIMTDKHVRFRHISKSRGKR